MSNAWRAAVLGGAAIVTAGIVFSSAVYEPRIDAAQRSALAYRDRTAVNRRILEEAPALRRAERRITTILADTRGPASSAETAMLLRRLEGLEARFHVVVTLLRPGKAQRVTSAHVIAQERTVIKLRGHFMDLLRFIAELPNRGALLGIRDVEIARSVSPRADAEVDAQMHADSYRAVERDWRPAW